MKPLLAIYLILLLIFPGCMMIPMALIPAITDALKTQPESVEKPAQTQGQAVDQPARRER